jgi:hypothetical protein
VILVLVIIIVAARLFAALEELGVPLDCSMELGGRVGVVLRSLVDISSDADVLGYSKADSGEWKIERSMVSAEFTSRKL